MGSKALVELSDNSISENSKNVNTINSIDIDEYDENSYNYVTLPSKEFNYLKSQVMTNFPNIKNVIHTIRLASTDSIYRYILDDDYTLTVLSKYKITNIHERNDINNVDRNGNEISGDNEVPEYGNGLYSGHAGQSAFREGTGANAQLNSAEVSEEGQSNGRGYKQDNSYDARNKKESRNVDESERKESRRVTFISAAYRDCKIKCVS